MSNALNAPRKKRRGIGASCSVLIRYLYPSNLVSERYPNKDKCDALGGIIITKRDVRRFTRRGQLFIFMKHEDFKDKELHCVQRWVIVDTEGSDVHFFNILNRSGMKGRRKLSPIKVRLLCTKQPKRI